MSEVTFRCRECGKEARFDARFRDVGLVCGYCYGTAVAVKEPEAVVSVAGSVGEEQYIEHL